MDASNSAEENKDKARSLTEVSNLGAMENACPEKTSEAAEENKMEVSSSADENKDKAEEQPKMSNQQGTPSLINQAENTSPDNLTPMDTSELKNKKTRQKPKLGKETKGLKAEGTKKSLMKCPKCEAEIAPSVTFYKLKDDQCHFNIGLLQDNGGIHTALFENKIAFKEPAGNVNEKCCLHCKQSIIYKSVAKRNNKMDGFDIELSINISKKEELEGETLETSSAMMNNLGRTQSQNRNCDNRGMKQNKGDSTSERSTGSNTDDSSKRRGNTVSSESTNSSSRKPEKSNQTTDSEKRSFSSHFKRPTPVVKVHYTPTSDTFGADTDIMKQLKNNLKSSVQLKETTRENCNIIIVFCPVSRSYESEVKSAMEKEAVSSSGKPFILVLMHYTRDPDYSTAGCDTSEVLKNLSYVHVFYHDNVQGLVKCRQNTQAIKDIEKKLKTHKQ